MHLILVCFALFSVCHVGLSGLAGLSGQAGLTGLSELSKLQGLEGLARLSELAKLQGSPPNIRNLLESQQESPSDLGLKGLLDQKLNLLKNRLSLLNKLQGRKMERIVCPTPHKRPVTSTEISGTAENTEEHTEHTEHPGHTTHAEPSSLEPTEPPELAGK
ncbi:hypothetical protein Anas_12341 [Armadillidium nasatum]|uniref:Uncharacterized protein n=1 Tax=Armadillidium nasatum TaxID=96803 RepID=A0A5N5T5X0_9CRUS|nr:hypothetical protein Anas_12341 [Armadillidium nasatum]